MKSFKIYLIGETNSGKSSILSVLKNINFNYNIAQTIGVDYWCFIEQNIKFEIYDTSGLDKFQYLTKTSLPNANLILICFDLSSKKAQKDVEKWLNFALNSIQTTPISFIGNKTDKIQERYNNNVNILIQNYDIYYTSAQNPDSVKLVFKNIVQKIVKQQESVDRIFIRQKEVDKKIKSPWFCFC